MDANNQLLSGTKLPKQALKLEKKSPLEESTPSCKLRPLHTEKEKNAISLVGLSLIKSNASDPPSDPKKHRIF